jgi:hypothetical protein
MQIRMLGARRRFLGVVFVAVSVLASCGSPDRFELTLRARDDNGQSLLYVDRVWVAADGRHATSPPNSGVFNPDPKMDFGEVECGARIGHATTSQLWVQNS